VRDDNSELFRRYTEVHRERGYPAKTIERLLTQAGLAVLSIEALTDAEQGMIGRLTALTDDAGRIVITARRSNAGADGGAAAGHSARR
jgi:hypothetical protein